MLSSRRLFDLIIDVVDRKLFVSVIVSLKRKTKILIYFQSMVLFVKHLEKCALLSILELFLDEINLDGSNFQAPNLAFLFSMETLALC